MMLRSDVKVALGAARSEFVEAPPQIEPQGLSDYLDVMSRAVMQTGISWAVVEKKWPGIRAAFAEFEPETVAGFDAQEIDRLVGDTRVIRNRRKLEGIVENARTMLELDSAPGGFVGFLRGGDYREREKRIRARFKFMGEMGVYYFLWVVREPVPDHDEWRAMTGRAAREPASVTT